VHNTTEHPLLTVAGFSAARQHVDTQFGRIAYVEAGDGPAAGFLHGFPLNSFHWRHQLTELSNDRRCIAIDMMGLGHSQVADDQDLSFNSQADMVLGAMDALDINRFDLIGNDTGGGIAQLLATKAPNRVTSLVLSNSDTHNNYPPKSLTTIHDAAGQNRLDDIFVAFLENPDSARNGLGSVVYENPMHLSDELLATYLRPLTATPARRRLVNRYIHSQDNAELVSIEPLLYRAREHRTSATEARGSDPDTVGNIRRIFRCRMGVLAGKDDSRCGWSDRIQRCQTVFLRRAFSGRLTKYSGALATLYSRRGHSSTTRPLTNFHRIPLPGFCRS